MPGPGDDVHPGNQIFPGNKTGTVTREMWSRSFLKWAGWPDSHKNMVAMIAWVSAEGSMARWNPLATTLDWEGATNFNSVGVKHYRSEQDGLNATLKTLKEDGHGYEPIRTRLRNSANPRKTLEAVEESSWGTGGLAKSIVDDVKNSYEHYGSQPIGQ